MCMPGKPRSLKPLPKSLKRSTAMMAWIGRTCQRILGETRDADGWLIHELIPKKSTIKTIRQRIFKQDRSQKL